MRKEIDPWVERYNLEADIKQREKELFQLKKKLKLKQAELEQTKFKPKRETR